MPHGKNLQRHDGTALSGLLMLVPGFTFIALGILVIIWPSVLPWLVAAAFIVAGSAMLLMARFMRGIGAWAGREVS